MTDLSEATQEMLKFIGALAVVNGLMVWWRKGSEADDKATVEAADLVLDSISDADKVGKIDLASGRNLRDQLSVLEAQELHAERELRKFGRRN